LKIQCRILFWIIIPDFFGGTIDCDCDEERVDGWEGSKEAILDAIAATIDWFSVFVIEVDVGFFI
jgi:hypothetical protein